MDEEQERLAQEVEAALVPTIHLYDSELPSRIRSVGPTLELGHKVLAMCGRGVHRRYAVVGAVMEVTCEDCLYA